MTQRIVVARPPNYDELVDRFDVAGKSVIFSWGDTIYNPGGMEIRPELLVHEGVHGRRQKDDVEGWWRKYIDDVDFRLHEEILAHCAEYGAIMAAENRKNRRQGLQQIAARLSGPLYGGIITKARAVAILKEAAR